MCSSSSHPKFEEEEESRLLLLLIPSHPGAQSPTCKLLVSEKSVYHLPFLFAQPFNPLEIKSRGGRERDSCPRRVDGTEKTAGSTRPMTWPNPNPENQPLKTPRMPHLAWSCLAAAGVQRASRVTLRTTGACARGLESEEIPHLGEDSRLWEEVVWERSLLRESRALRVRAAADCGGLPGLQELVPTGAAHRQSVRTGTPQTSPITTTARSRVPDSASWQATHKCKKIARRSRSNQCSAEPLPTPRPRPTCEPRDRVWRGERRIVHAAGLLLGALTSGWPSAKRAAASKNKRLGTSRGTSSAATG